MLLKVHPYAELLPMPPPEALQALTDSIREHGQMVPIVVKDGQIVDGRCRFFACNELGIEPKTVEWDGSDNDEELLEAVLSLNISRRQLSKTQRIAVAATLFKRNPNASRRLAARSCGIDDRFVQMALDINCGMPELYERMLQDDMMTPEQALKEYRKQMKCPAKAEKPKADEAQEPEKEPDAAKKVPKLEVPKDSRFGVFVYGDRNQVLKLADEWMERGLSHMLAELSADGQWTTETYRGK